MTVAKMPVWTKLIQRYTITLVVLIVTMGILLTAGVALRGQYHKKTNNLAYGYHMRLSLLANQAEINLHNAWGVRAIEGNNSQAISKDNDDSLNIKYIKPAAVGYTLIALLDDIIRVEKQYADMESDSSLLRSEKQFELIKNTLSNQHYQFTYQDKFLVLDLRARLEQINKIHYNQLLNLENEIIRANLTDQKFTIVIVLLLGIFLIFITIRSTKMVREIMRRQVDIEADMTIAQQEAIAANQSKSSFLANMSHDLRTPLNAIIGFSDIMKSGNVGVVENIKHKEYLEYISSSGHQLVSLINDLMDIAKIEAGKRSLNEECFNINDLLVDAKAMAKPLSMNEHVLLEVHTNEDLPYLFAERMAVAQILNNLLSNAIKFTQPDGLVVAHTMLNSDGRFKLIVKDEGIGMDEKQVEQALDPFGQVHDIAPTSQVSTGLGLNICKQLIEMHGGELLIESCLGKGTTATALFPSDRIRACPDIHTVDDFIF